jgi:hypothetical protein
MTFRELTELQEMSQNAAYERNYAQWKPMAGTNWITAGDGLRPEMDCGQGGIAAGKGLRLEMDHDWMWMNDHRGMTGGG